MTAILCLQIHLRGKVRNVSAQTSHVHARPRGSTRRRPRGGTRRHKWSRKGMRGTSRMLANLRVEVAVVVNHRVRGSQIDAQTASTLSTRTHIHTRVHIHIHIRIHIPHTHTRTHTRTPTHTRTHARTHTTFTFTYVHSFGRSAVKGERTLEMRYTKMVESLALNLRMSMFL